MRRPLRAGMWRLPPSVMRPMPAVVVVRTVEDLVRAMTAGSRSQPARVREGRPSESEGT